LLATRTRTTSSSSRSRSTSAGNHRTRMGIGTGVKPDQSILVENHGAGTHFVCWDEMGGLGPGDPLRDFDEVRIGRTVDHRSLTDLAAICNIDQAGIRAVRQVGGRAVDQGYRRLYVSNGGRWHCG
jgi:hypothetical protein